MEAVIRKWGNSPALRLPVSAYKDECAPFTQEQIHWLEMIRDHIAANLGLEIDELNRELAA